MIILIKYCTDMNKCKSFRGFGYIIIIIIIIIIIRKMYENLQATTSSNFLEYSYDLFLSNTKIGGP